MHYTRIAREREGLTVRLSMRVLEHASRSVC